MQKRPEFLLAALTLLPLLYPGICAAQNYRMAVLPRYFPIYMHERFIELANAIEADTGFAVELEIADSYDNHVDSVNSGMAQFSFQNPLIYIKVANEVVPVAVATQDKGGTRMQGMIIVRRDSGITAPKDYGERRWRWFRPSRPGDTSSRKSF